MDFGSGHTFRYITKTCKSLTNKFDTQSLTPELTFSEQRKIDMKFSTSIVVWNLCFSTLNAPHIDERDSKPQTFTRKTPKYT